jgi:hypothetical protein
MVTKDNIVVLGVKMYYTHLEVSAEEMRGSLKNE